MAIRQCFALEHTVHAGTQLAVKCILYVKCIVLCKLYHSLLTTNA